MSYTVTTGGSSGEYVIHCYDRGKLREICHTLYDRGELMGICQTLFRVNCNLNTKILRNNG